MCLENQQSIWIYVSRDNYEKMQAEIRLAKEELVSLERAKPSRVRDAS